MGLLDLFRTKDTRATGTSTPDASYAVAYSDELFRRIVGDPISLGVKMVGAELSAGRPAQYCMLASPEKFRLGVLGYFGLLAATLPEKTGMFGVIYTAGSASSAQYLNDRYGTKMATAQNFLDAFGITLKQRYDRQLMRGKERVLAILPESEFLSLGGVRGDMFPVIKDDGEKASTISGVLF